MARGRPPKPVEQRRLEGGSTVSHRPVPEALLVAGRPDLEELREPPDDLLPDAKPFWRETIVMLAEVGIIDRVDKPMLILMAQTWAIVRMCDRVIAQKGLFGHGAAGQMRIAPWMTLRANEATAFARLCSEFGIGAVARTRLGLASLSARAMAQEMQDSLDGPGEDEPVDAEVVDDELDGDIGLPGT